MSLIKEFTNKKLIPIAIVIAGFLVAGAFIYINYINQTPKEEGEILSLEQAAEKAIDFISQAVQQENAAVSLLDIVEESGVYKINLKIEETEYTSYITKDGKFLFASGFNLEEQPEE